MVTEMLGNAALTIAALLFSSCVHASADLPDSLDASQIKTGCNVNFLKREYLREPGKISNPSFDILMRWDCDDGRSALIDRYYVDGANPEIITILFWKKRSIAVLVKWPIRSQAADIQGDFYQTYIYRYVSKGKKTKFIKEESIMKKFGEGWDGEWRDGRISQYRFKDAASIRKKLTELKY